MLLELAYDHLSGAYAAEIEIENVYDQNVAYKVKTLTPQLYVVKPTQGLLESGQRVLISI